MKSFSGINIVYHNYINIRLMWSYTIKVDTNTCVIIYHERSP